MRQDRLLLGLVFLFVALLIGSWILPAPGSHREWHTPSRRSLVQLRTLAQGCIVYAANNNDQLPALTHWRELLIEHLEMSERQFLSTVAETIEESYFMAPSAMMWDERSILLYENPDHWEDFVNVAFGDSSAEQMPHAEFERCLAEQLRTTDP